MVSCEALEEALAAKKVEHAKALVEKDELLEEAREEAYEKAMVDHEEFVMQVKNDVMVEHVDGRLAASKRIK
ncbi:hypothetical protein VNO78_04733 [Psophocarpus tetragonolobus]|uniref:Uncharacterized protein n=1 Tax=Psophocarpus tetragonolobus TaxID=3891 RepID=A0AAN9T5T9_PSOTE